MYNKQKAFTLVELLVVISIIALLMAILMPSLQMAKRQAQTVVCQSNLRQWSIGFSMYTGDHNGRFMQGYTGDSNAERRRVWMVVLDPYMSKDGKIRVCPRATKSLQDGGVYPFAAYEQSPNAINKWWPEGWKSSYGINSWIYDYDNKVVTSFYKVPTTNCWRTVNQRNIENVPLLMDASWANGWPTETSQPPIFNGDISATPYNDMKRLCMDRHDGTDVMFLDFSARKVVDLKMLWNLKWHKSFDTELNYNDGRWPSWMK